MNKLSSSRGRRQREGASQSWRRLAVAALLSVSSLLTLLVVGRSGNSQRQTEKTDSIVKTQATRKHREAAVVVGDKARKLLGKERGQLLKQLEKQSQVPVTLSVDAATGAVLLLRLNYPAGAPGVGAEKQARAFLRDFQPLIDPRVGANEYVALKEKQGCDDSVVVLTRAVKERPVLGSELTLHFSRAGQLIGVVNGVASVPAKLLPASAMDETRRKIQELQSRQTKTSTSQRYSVIVPEGSGDEGHLRQANLVVWDEAQKDSGRVYKGAFEGMKGGLVGPFAVRDMRNLPVGAGRLQVGLPSYHKDPQTGLPDSISYHAVGGVAVEKLPGEHNAAEIVYRFLGQHRALFGTGAPRCQYAVKSIHESPLLPGVQFVRMEQRYIGLPVFGAELVFEVQDENKIMSIEGHVLPSIDLNPVPSLGSAAAASRAREILVNALRTERSGEVSDIEKAEATTELLVFPGEIVPDRKLPNRLAYRVTLRDYVYFVDAQTGDELYSYSTRMGSIPIIKDAEGRSDSFDSYLIYKIVWIDSASTNALTLNADVSSLVTTIKTVDAFYRTLGRDSWDGNGAQYVANTNVALAKGCAGAYFAHSYNEVFLCLGVGQEPDAVAHEFTHGVVSSSSNLVSGDQPGALNEAYADLFGNLIFPDNPSRGATSAWLIGEPPTSGGSRTRTGTIRDMQTPGNFSAPGTMSQFQSRSAANGCTGVPSSCDDGFVHSNSGIINRAHTLLADGIPVPTPLPSPTPTPSPLPFPTLGPRQTPGIGRSKLTKLAYIVMTEKLTKWSRFTDASLATRNLMRTFVANGESALDGTSYVQRDMDEVKFAFDAVGLDPEYDSGWGERALGFSGTESRLAGATTFDNNGNGCTIANVLLSMPSNGSGELGADLSPTTPTPSSVNFRGLYGGGFVLPSDGTTPPIGTTNKAHTISWFNVFGFKPRINTLTVANIPTSGIPDCRTPQGFTPRTVRVPFPDSLFHESPLLGEGGDGTDSLGNASSAMDPGCNITRVDVELLDDDGQPITSGSPGAAEIFRSVSLFGQTASETRGARITTNPPSGTGQLGQTRDLSVSLRWFFTGYYGKIRYRIMYSINEPSGVVCQP